MPDDRTDDEIWNSLKPEERLALRGAGELAAGLAELCERRDAAPHFEAAKLYFEAGELARTRPGTVGAALAEMLADTRAALT